MEFKNETSKIKFEENKLLTENNNLIFNTKDTKYLTINYDKIKGYSVFSYNRIPYLIYLFAFLFAIQIGQKVEIWEGANGSPTDYKGYTHYVERTPIQKIGMGVVTLGIIGFGIYFSKRYGGYYNLKLKHFEGKNKVSKIYTSNSMDEINEIQNEIQLRLK
jgi:hypothetical protein